MLGSIFGRGGISSPSFIDGFFSGRRLEMRLGIYGYFSRTGWRGPMGLGERFEASVGSAS